MVGIEELVVRVFENTLVGGAFVYLLWYITKNFKDSLDKITDTLSTISSTLKDMDARITNLEKGGE